MTRIKLAPAPPAAGHDPAGHGATPAADPQPAPAPPAATSVPDGRRLAPMAELKLAPGGLSDAPAARPHEPGEIRRLRAVGLRPEILLVLAILAAGCALRLIHWSGWHFVGVDEGYYAQYLEHLARNGLGGYPEIVDGYKEYQKTLTGSILPPTRFLYIFFAYGWHEAFGSGWLESFRAVSRLFGVLTLVLSGLFARRILPDRRLALGVFALAAFSPLQIHMAQHALVDGFFEFWALGTLWALWECLRHPGHKGWLTAFAAGLAAMVLTKENAFFVWVAVVALIVLNRWLKFGVASRALVALTFVGPLVGVAVLVNLAGGLRELLDVYRLGVPKNLTLPYAIQTGDGPWYRYLLDLMTMSPLVLLLGVGMALQLRPSPESGRDDRALLFLVGFIAASYALMCNVKYGMNLRYATIWDLPLRVLAMAQVGSMAASLPVKRRAFALTLAVIGLCAFDVYQYYRLAVLYPLYELAPSYLLTALKILK